MCNSLGNDRLTPASYICDLAWPDAPYWLISALSCRDFLDSSLLSFEFFWLNSQAVPRPHGSVRVKDSSFASFLIHYIPRPVANTSIWWYPFESWLICQWQLYVRFCSAQQKDRSAKLFSEQAFYCFKLLGRESELSFIISLLILLIKIQVFIRLSSINSPDRTVMDT